MSSEPRELLGIDPVELRFAYEYVAFKVKTTNPKKYCVRPNNGIVAPRSASDVLVTMQAQLEVPPDMQCKDKFLVQSAIVSQDITPKDISGGMFMKESGNVVDEVKLKVVYAPPSQPTSINEGSDQESVGSLSYQETRRESKEPETITSEPSALISKLKEEKNSAIQQNNKLREELDLLRREISRQNGGFSLVFVLVVAILGILIGFLMKR